ncbi:MAG: DUF3833 domain-containing protein [Pseudomonadota bacterium]
MSTWSPSPTATRRWLLAVGAAWLLSGCASQRIDGYAAQRPALDLKTYFNGRLLAHGMFQDRGGQVVRRFVVEMTGTWDGHQGVLDERFTYSDGKTERRVWRLVDEGNGRYRGTADDVVGEARGQVSGNAFHWRYTLRLPVDGTVYEVELDDWMYLIDERVMLNRAEMRKWGIRLGEVTLAFTKLSP